MIEEKQSTQKREPCPVIIDIRNSVLILTGLVLSFQVMSVGNHYVNKGKAFDYGHRGFEQMFQKSHSDEKWRNIEKKYYKNTGRNIDQDDFNTRIAKNVALENEMRLDRDRIVAADVVLSDHKQEQEGVSLEKIELILIKKSDEIKARGKVVVRGADIISRARDVESESSEIAKTLSSSASGSAEGAGEKVGAQGSSEGKPLRMGFFPDGREMNQNEKNLQVKSLFDALPKDYTINWIAEDERATIYVFTDPTCGYCKQLHDSIPEINKLGISVKYMMYPRDLPSSSASQLSPTALNLTNVWCSVDQKSAFNDAFNGYKVAPASCSDLPDGESRMNAPVTDHYSIGRLLKVEGTPTIVTGDGRVFTGFGGITSLARNVLQ